MSLTGDDPPETGYDAALYRGTAKAYDRYRPAYPDALISHLVTSTCATGHGRLVDLGCGTGQLAFALADSFAKVLAVDREPDMVRVVDEKAAAGGARVRGVVSAAEDVEIEPASVDVVTIGNAFHRLDRERVAATALGWLRPGGHLALCWMSSPWAGALPWQRDLASLLDDWRRALGVLDRIPAEWQAPIERRPHAEVLAAAGFEVLGRTEYEIACRWTVQELTGLVTSTSFLPALVLGDRVARLEREIGSLLAPALAACDLAKKPASREQSQKPREWSQKPRERSEKPHE